MYGSGDQNREKEKAQKTETRKQFLYLDNENSYLKDSKKQLGKPNQIWSLPKVPWL